MKILKPVIIAVVFIAVCVVAGTAGLIFINHPPEPFTEEEFFKISRGQNLASIARGLEDHGFIKYADGFELYSRVMKTGGKMKAGFYRIERGATLKEIHDLLLSGQQELYRVTIPEGWTIRKIAGELEKKGITSARDFIREAGEGSRLSAYGFDMKSAEGFLYPDTYNFPLEYPAGKVVDTMIENFFLVLKELYPDYDKITAEDLYDKIILSSIIEREYRVKDEAPLIASVFYNRLKDSMALGSCATVVYIITDIQEKEHPEVLFYSDLEIPSEFNTYINTGLPPAPIANPGYTALDAAFYPEVSDYYYFLLQDPNAGRHYFSRTYGEHNQAYSLYIKKG